MHKKIAMRQIMKIADKIKIIALKGVISNCIKSIRAFFIQSARFEYCTFIQNKNIHRNHKAQEIQTKKRYKYYR